MANRKMLGDFIYELRKEKGLSQSELGDLCGVSNKAVSKWETNEANPDLSVIRPLSEALGVTADELLRCERRPEPGKNSCETASQKSFSLKQFFSQLEYKSESKTKNGTPIVHINFSSLKAAHGVIAIGFNAKGVIAIGLCARGVLALGILSLGLFALGMLSLGLILAAGGIALGGVALGGVVAGVVAIGGVAVGVYALGGVAVGWWAVTGTGGYAFGEHITILQTAYYSFFR